ncbi:hypothetical protein B0F90DRAFT_1926244 [Multifurca ochricompacta]|uniref:F-box domain-containing protein n=1 Tax=Multifurca ochricompacta TaxID=376703 RepID=A0AAD4M4G2_9AGAM|nr:hypothetical protein B0F90DRAFT_1926244 [Multifurca ochricompacta]
MQKARPTMFRDVKMNMNWLTRGLNCRLWTDDLPLSHPNSGNAAVELPTELLRLIFFLCVEDPTLANRRQRCPPSWISITYVCRRWRTVALGFLQLWSIITPDLSPQWVTAFLKRSSYLPLHISFNVGPVHRESFRKRVKLGRKQRSTAAFSPLPGQTIKKILSHVPRMQKLQISGNGVDVIRILKSFDFERPVPLDSLTIRVRDGYVHNLSRNDTSETLIVPQTFLGGDVCQLRHLHCWSSLHLTFPSWVFKSISELTVSMDFSLNRLFVVLQQMPQLKALKITFIQRYFRMLDRGFTPVRLKSLSLLVLETCSLDLFIALSTYLLLSTDAHRHFTFTVPADCVGDNLWNRFVMSLKKEITSIAPTGIHGFHFKWQRETTCIRAWMMPVESPLSPSSWPPLDDRFSLEVRCTSFGCYHLHSSTVHEFTFHYLQELCVSLGQETAKDLSVEYITEDNALGRCRIPHPCWRTLFSGLPNVTTLRFGDGASDLLISASCGTIASRTRLGRGHLPNLRKVQVTQGHLCTKTLKSWIQHVLAQSVNMRSDLEIRIHVLSLLMGRQHQRSGVVSPSSSPWRSGGARDAKDNDKTSDVSESLLLFLLHWRSKRVCISELSLPEYERGSKDESDALELFERLLCMLDWEVVLDAGSDYY